MTVTIAIAQMCSGIDPAENAAQLAAAIDEASVAGAAMLFAPEMSAMLDRDRTRASAHVVREQESEFVAAMCAAARAAAIWLHIGSLPVLGDESADRRWRNRSLIIGPDGHIRGRYDKIHLFDADLPTGESWRESNGFAPGAEGVIVDDTPVGRLGCSICYDMRFAALYDAYGAAGCTAIAVPAAFTVPTGTAHWHVLLRARAIEQGAFIIAAAQSGTHADGRSTYGHSLVVDPWGHVLLDMGLATGVGYATLDLDRVPQTRTQLPAISHRRPIAAIQRPMAR